MSDVFSLPVLDPDAEAERRYERWRDRLDSGRISQYQKIRMIRRAHLDYGLHITPCHGFSRLEDCFTIEGHTAILWFNDGLTTRTIMEDYR